MRSQLFHILWLLCMLVYLTGCMADNSGAHANAGSDQTVMAGQEFQLNGLLSSASTGLVRKYKWRQISGVPVEFNDTTLAMPRITAPQVANQQVLHFELEIMGEQSGADTDQVTITVLPEESVPESLDDSLLVDGQGTYQINDSIQLNVIWSGDQAALQSNYVWKQASGKAVDFTVADSTLSLTMIAPLVDQRETLVFQVSVETVDGSEQIAAAEVVVMPTEYPKFEVSGIVKTARGAPLGGVELRVIEDGLANDKPLITESDGKFSFQLEQGFDYVLAFTKKGYVEQVIPVAQQSVDSVNIINSVMIEPTDTVNFNQQGRIEFIGDSGTGVVFNMAQFVDDQGAVLNGDLELSLTTTNMARSSDSQAYFGLFAGFMADSVDSAIVSNLGMAKFNFTQQGVPVDLDFGEVVEILIPLHLDRFEDGEPIRVGDEVPLWSFNVERGSWEQEGDGIVEESSGSPTGLVIRGELTQLSW